MYKPTVCALFPLGRGTYNNNGKSKTIYVLQPTTCSDYSEKHTLREWLDNYNLNESEQWASLWQEIVIHISNRIHELQPFISERVRLEMDNNVAKILYLRYNPDLPFIPQIKENGTLIEKMLSMVESMAISNK